MPALFDRAPAPPPGRRYRPGTVAVSVAIHAVLLVGIIVAQLGAAFDGLAVNTRLDQFVIPTPPTPPPQAAEPPPPTDQPEPTAAVNADAAPVEANDVVLPEPPPRPATGDRPVPGALTTAGSAGPVRLASTGAPPSRLAPPPPRPDPIRPGGDISFPERTTHVPPAYPDVARAARAEGTVVLEATIDETGRVRNVRVLRSVPLLDEAAMSAVRQWRYRPTLLNGVAVPVLLNVTVTFTLRR